MHSPSQDDSTNFLQKLWFKIQSPFHNLPVFLRYTYSDAAYIHPVQLICGDWIYTQSPAPCPHLLTVPPRVLLYDNQFRR